MNQTSTWASSRSAARWRKPLLFAFYTACGALAAAVPGELWLKATAPPPPPPPVLPPPQSIVLLIDTSGSMGMAGKLDEVKRAAVAFVRRQDLSRTRIALVHFDNLSEMLSPLSRDPVVLEKAIDSLNADGFTRMDLGISMALELLRGSSERNSILLFTDGVPEADDPRQDVVAQTVDAAQKVRSSGVRLLCIATGDADLKFLASLTADSHRVFWASAGNFDEAFRQAELALAPPNQLVESGSNEDLDPEAAVERIAVWTALIGLGASLALLLAQKRSIRRRPSPGDLLGALGGCIAGGAAGALGQWAYQTTSEAAGVLFLWRVAGWSLLGAALGFGMALFVPNLPPRRAALGGAVGGALGAVAFVAASGLDDLLGRWIGAATIGFFIGLMIGLVEVVFRRAWLHVSEAGREEFDMTLGETAIAVGKDGEKCRILAREAPAIAGRFGLEAGQVYFEEAASGRREFMTIGQSLTFGKTTITVFGEAAPDATSAPVGATVMPAKVGTAWTRSAAPVRTAPIAGGQRGAAPVAKRTVAPAGEWLLAHPSHPIHLSGIGSQYEIGRDPRNQIVLSDAAISARHAALEITSQGLTVTDLDSTNGSFVNSRRIAPHQPQALQPNDRLSFGSRHYVVTEG